MAKLKWLIGDTRCICIVLQMTTPSKWLKWLAWAEYICDTSYHSFLQSTSFQIVYGRQPPPLLSYNSGDVVVGEVDSLLQQQVTMLVQLRLTLHAAQQRMKYLANAKRHEVEFALQDWVYIKLHLYRQQNVFCHLYPKLAPAVYWSFSNH